MSLSRIERLDLVARSKASVPVISYASIVLLILAPFLVLLAVNSTAGFRETAIVAVLAGTSLLTAIILWLNWRFKLYLLSLFCFSFVIANLISNDHPKSNTLLGWVGGHVWGLLFIYYGCGLWIMARRYAMANEGSFRTERDQFEKWMDEHSGSAAFEFPTGSFWTGYWTYRILNPGDCWIVAKSKRGANKWGICRVYELNEVNFTRLPSGKWRIDVMPKSGKTQSFVEIDVPLPVQSIFAS